MTIHHSVVCILVLILVLFGGQNTDARDVKEWNTLGEHNDRYHVGSGGYACGELTHENCHPCEESAFDSVPIFCNKEHWAQRMMSDSLHHHVFNEKLCEHGRDDNLEKCHMAEFRSCCQCVAPYCSLVLKGDFHHLESYVFSFVHVITSLILLVTILVLIYTQSFKHDKDLHQRIGKFSVNWIVLPWIFFAFLMTYIWISIEHHGLNPFLWHMHGPWQFMRMNWYYLGFAAANPSISMLVSFKFLSSEFGYQFFVVQMTFAVFSAIFFFTTAHWEFFQYLENAPYVLAETAEMYFIFAFVALFDVLYHCYYLPKFLFLKGVKYQTWKAYHAYEAARFTTVAFFSIVHVASRKKEFTTEWPWFPLFADFCGIAFAVLLTGQRVYDLMKDGHEFAREDNAKGALKDTKLEN